MSRLSKEFVVGMKKAANRANSRNIPVVLDVCGAGTTPFTDLDFFLPSMNDTFTVALPWRVDFGGCVKNYSICYNGHSKAGS